MTGYFIYYESLGEVFIPESEYNSGLTIYSECFQGLSDEQIKALITELGSTVEDYETREDFLEFAAWWFEGDIAEGSAEYSELITA